MSVDERVATDIIETLKDGQKGFTQAADKLENEATPATIQALRGFAQQRAGFAADLEAMAAHYGDDIDEDGSLAAAAHRGWMALKDALTGSDASAVLKACVNGEEHAVSEYEKALTEDISDGLRTKLEAQLADVRNAHTEIAAMANA